MRCRWMRAIDLVTSVTSIDLSGRLELRCFATRVAFVRELQNHGHAYRFPGNPADAYYLPDDSVVLIGTYVSPVNWVIDFICFHEIFHHIYRREIGAQDRSRVRRASSTHRDAIVEAFSDCGRSMPWPIEERLCDMFAARLAEHIPRRYRPLASLYGVVIEPTLSRRR